MTYTSKIRGGWEPVRAFWRVWGWPIIWALGVASFVCGYVGFAQYYQSQGEVHSVLELVYRTLQLYVLQSGALDHPVPWALEVARFLAPAVFGYTATRALTSLLREQFLTFWLWRRREHVVVCGLGRKGLQIAKDFSNRYSVVVIEPDAHNDRIRHCRDFGARVLIGDASDIDLLRQAGVARARYVVATTGDDGVNVEIVLHARELVQSRPAMFSHTCTCLVHIVDSTLCAVFKMAPTFTSGKDWFEATVFNIYENCARQLFEVQPLDRVPIGVSSRVSVHLVVIGFGQMGQAVALQAARVGHFANGRRLRISVVDRNAKEAHAAFLALYPRFGDICDIEFVHALAGSAEVNERLIAWATEENAMLTVAICLDNDTRSLTRALAIAEKLREYNVPVRVRMEEDTGLASLLVCEGVCHPSIAYIRAFGQIDRVCALNRLLSEEQDRKARRLHNRFIAVARQDLKRPKDDPALLDWEKLPETYKESNRQAADHLPVKLRAIGITENGDLTRELKTPEIEILARMEHARWMAERQLSGWKYAPGPKNDTKKTNPNLVAWSKLDRANKDKDRGAVREMVSWLRVPTHRSAT